MSSAQKQFYKDRQDEITSRRQYTSGWIYLLVWTIYQLNYLLVWTIYQLNYFAILNYASVELFCYSELCISWTICSLNYI
jgi:hypothetical protein